MSAYYSESKTDFNESVHVSTYSIRRAVYDRVCGMEFKGRGMRPEQEVLWPTRMPDTGSHLPPFRTYTLGTFRNRY